MSEPGRENSAAPRFGPDHPWLAPLAGYSDLPFRLLCREFGASACETEMISARGLFHQAERTRRLLAVAPEDGPLAVQLFGSETEVVAAAAKSLREAGFRHFDFNAGCSVRKVLRQGAGAALLGDPGRFMEIARALIAVVREGGGMAGFKLRLGLDRSRATGIDLGVALEDAGADWLTLHPRYAKDGFSGAADWDEIARLVERTEIPIIASGDLFTAADGFRCLKHTKAAGVMYARGALHNPLIFADHAALLRGGEPRMIDRETTRRLIARHIELARLYGPEPKVFYKTRSLLPRYARRFPGVSRLRLALTQAADWAELDAILDAFFAGDD